MGTNNSIMFSKFRDNDYSSVAVGGSLNLMTSLLCLTLVVLIGVSHGADAQLYRYKNESGVMVIEDKIPPEFAARGYDVLGYDGTVIKRVKRQLTQEELELRNTEEARARQREDEQKRLQDWDASLMRRYSSTDDINAAKDRAMRDLQIRVEILKSNLNNIKIQIEREQKKAADIERRGGTVPEELLKNIDILRLEIEDTEQSIDARRKEVDSVKAAFERDMARFETLLDHVEMRRRQSPSTAQKPGKKPLY